MDACGEASFSACSPVLDSRHLYQGRNMLSITDLYIYILDTVPPIHVV